MFSVFLRVIEHEVVIDSTPWSIWRTISDFSAYGRWNALFPSVAGEMKAGYSLNVGARLMNDNVSRMTFRVAAIEHLKEMVWTSSVSLPGLMDMVYGVAIAPVDRHHTRLTMGLQLHGLLVPILGKSVERSAGKHMTMTIEQLAAMAKHHARQGMTVS